MKYVSWEFVSGRPLYLQLAEHIQLDVLSGKYRLGERLPSVRELALIASVNPNTMWRALQTLEEKGLITAQRTTGWFVTESQAALQAIRADMANAYTAEYLAKMRHLGYTNSGVLEVLQRGNGGGIENGRDPVLQEPDETV